MRTHNLTIVFSYYIFYFHDATIPLFNVQLKFALYIAGSNQLPAMCVDASNDKSDYLEFVI